MTNRVQIPQGEVEGVGFKSFKDKEYVGFLGIPYAEAPVKEKRFKHPEPHKGWEGVFKADKIVEILQVDMISKKIKGDEGGLVLNVFATKDDLGTPDNKTPVMVWIHGGAFVTGSASPEIYNPQWLMDHGTIFVTINYRLGPLGFMATGDNSIPANLGLWDQRLALVWVKNNIGRFGGDPNNVTIFGESAGAMSVCFHLLSPKSEGLFHKAIAQSGVPFASFCKSDKHPAVYTRKIVKALGGDATASSEELLKFLQDVDGKVLIEKCIMTNVFREEDVFNGKADFFFKPVVDDFCSDPFLPEEPIELLKKGHFKKIPFLTGFNKDEGMMMLPTFQNAKLADLEKYNRSIEKFASHDFLSRDVDEVDESDRKIIKEILDRTLGKQVLDNRDETLLKYMEVFGDAIFMAPCQEFVQKYLVDNSSPVYQYRYSYPGPVSLTDLFGSSLKLMCRIAANTLLKWDVLRDKERKEVCHGDEIFLMWNFQALPLVKRWSSDDMRVSELLMVMWTNFAKTGDPTPDGQLGFKWSCAVPGEDLYLEIGQKNPHMWQDPAEVERLGFWREVFNQTGLNLHLKRSSSWSNAV